jgi:hypothetical protein
MVDGEMGDGPTAESIFASLSPEQRKTLETMFLASNQKPEKMVAVGAAKLQRWPEWDGEPSSFLLYFHQLKGKIEADETKMGNNAAICNQIIGTIPQDKRQRVAHWYISGGDDGQFDIDDFLALIKEKFEDRESVQTAGRQLYLIRMGSSQRFESFLQDFEYKLAQCKGLGWPDETKILMLRPAINLKLSTSLIPVELPESDYRAWVRKVGSVAAKLEAHPGYKSDRQTKTWYAKGAPGVTYPTAQGMSSSSGDHQQAGGSEPPATVDAEGDTPMSGVNQLAALLINAIGRAKKNGKRKTHSNFTVSTNSVAGSDKPRAKWISSEELAKLAGAGKCFRCRKKGHIGNQCPDFRPAKRPGGGVNSTRTKAVESSDSEEDFESCSSDSDPNPGKE